MNPIEIANTAHDKGFQWWFLALLAIVLMGGIWALRYLLNKSERDRQSFDVHITQLMADNRDAREHHHNRVEAMQMEALSVAREVTAMVAKATTVIESNTRLIERLESKRQ